MLKPQNNQVILKWSKETEEQFTSSGIIIPTAAEEVKIIEQGEVIAVADKILDKNGEEMNIKVGDKVLFATFHPFELELNGDKAYALPASEIVAILGNE
jgi:chaperonin GroES